MASPLLTRPGMFALKISDPARFSPALHEAQPGPQLPVIRGLCNMHQRKCQNVVQGVTDIVHIVINLFLFFIVRLCCADC